MSSKETKGSQSKYLLTKSVNVSAPLYLIGINLRGINWYIVKRYLSKSLKILKRKETISGSIGLNWVLLFIIDCLRPSKPLIAFEVLLIAFFIS